MFFTIVVFMIILAVFDLFVGVSNDAVNFLSPAVGAKVAKRKTILAIAAAGVIIGALMSNGMMDIARHGIFNPSYFTFNDVMTIYLAVMVTDVIVLDLFNTLKLPTSTTVSLVFELLGAAFIISVFKMNSSLELSELLNFEKAFTVILAIFVSIAIAFLSAVVVQWFARMIFTYNYKNKATATIIYGAIAITLLVCFIFMKGFDSSNILKGQSICTLILIVFIINASVTSILYKFKLNIFKFIVLLGTFSLAMAFAGNDLVNFIGVPLASVSSYMDFSVNGNGNPDSFIMESLNNSAQTPKIMLLLAGAIMIVAMCFSRKAKDVIKTSVDLSSQDESDNMFGSSLPARAIVRNIQKIDESITTAIPKSVKRFIASRFNRDEAVKGTEGAAFDMVRASVNLVLAALLIIIGTIFTLPLSTTYVTFMVAMGSSLADKAWGRESAVFRVTGVLSVIGGWLITAGLAFATCAIICILMYKGGLIVMIGFMAICTTMLIISNFRKKNKNSANGNSDQIYAAMIKCHDPEIMNALLNEHISLTQSTATKNTIKHLNDIMNAFYDNNSSQLSKIAKAIDRQRYSLKKEQKKEILCLRRLPEEFATERSTWFYLGMNSAEQYYYCLKRLLDPISDHIGNSFTPILPIYQNEIMPIVSEILDIMKTSAYMIEHNDFSRYEGIRNRAEKSGDNLSALRTAHIKRLQQDENKNNLRIAIVYLNTIQELQILISTMRHQIRAVNKLIES